MDGQLRIARVAVLPRPETRSPGSASAGGSSSAGREVSRKSASVAAAASRLVSGGRFHLCSIVARIEVWSCTTFVTERDFEYGETTTVGTRGP